MGNLDALQEEFSRLEEDIALNDAAITAVKSVRHGGGGWKRPSTMVREGNLYELKPHEEARIELAFRSDSHDVPNEALDKQLKNKRKPAPATRTSTVSTTASKVKETDDVDIPAPITPPTTVSTTANKVNETDGVNILIPTAEEDPNCPG